LQKPRPPGSRRRGGGHRLVGEGAAQGQGRAQLYRGCRGSAQTSRHTEERRRWPRRLRALLKKPLGAQRLPPSMTSRPGPLTRPFQDAQDRPLHPRRAARSARATHVAQRAQPSQHVLEPPSTALLAQKSLGTAETDKHRPAAISWPREVNPATQTQQREPSNRQRAAPSRQAPPTGPPAWFPRCRHVCRVYGREGSLAASMTIVGGGGGGAVR